METHERVELFIHHGIYLRNWSPKTVRTYRQSLSALTLTEPFTKTSLNALVIRMRERGLSPGSINIRLRTLNSFLTWLHEEGHAPERLKVKLLRAERKAVTTFSDGDVRRIVVFKPTDENQQRAWTLVLTLLDTGIRIEEALGLERRRVNLEALTLTVLGKGSRERIVPISTEGRKHLFRLMSKGTARLVFSTRDGERLAYRNIARDIKALCAAAGLKGVRVHPHAFRHYFAVSYIRAGGDLYRLSRILGHSSLTTTQIYLRSMGVEHLREGHHSPLMRT